MKGYTAIEGVSRRLWTLFVSFTLGFAFPAFIQLVTVGADSVLNSLYGDLNSYLIGAIFLFVLGIWLLTFPVAWFGGILLIAPLEGTRVDYYYGQYLVGGYSLGFIVFALAVLNPQAGPWWTNGFLTTINMNANVLVFKYGPGLLINLFWFALHIGISDSSYEDDEAEQGHVANSQQVTPASVEPAQAGSEPQAVPASRPVKGPQETAEKIESPENGVRLAAENPADRSVWQVPPALDFTDVVGYDDEKYRLINSIGKFGNAEDRAATANSPFDIDPARTVLLHGPPGTGKTHLARALAGEVGGAYIELSAGDILSDRVNKSTLRVKELFLDAVTMEGPTVIFIDNLEALIPDRTADIPQPSRQVASELLKRIEDIEPASQVLFIGATDSPDVLDEATLSPTTFDLTLEIGLPERDDRDELIRDALMRRTHSLDHDDVEWLVEETEGMSCAEVEQLIEEASRRAQLRDSDAVGSGDFTKALLS